MKKKYYQKIILVIIISFLIVSLPTALLAAESGQSSQSTKTSLFEKLKKSGKEGGYKENLTSEYLPEIVANIVKIVLSLLGVIFICLIIYGGFLWMTAAGNEERIKKARAIIANAAIGLAIVLAAYAITVFVINAIQTASGGVGGESGVSGDTT